MNCLRKCNLWMLRLLVMVLMYPEFGYTAPVAGRTIIVSGTIQAAIEVAQPGDVLQLEERTYNEKLEITTSGTNGTPIVLRGAAQGSTILKGRIRILGVAWQLEDFAINPTDSGDAIRIESPAHNITIQRLHLYGGRAYGIRIGNNVSTVRIKESSIHAFDAGSSDAHGIGIMTASDITIRDCEIYANSGDGIQVNTPDYPGYGLFAQNILIENNKLYGNRENALDVKSTRQLLAQGNEMWGAQSVSSSDGMAVQVQYDAQDIRLLSNIIRDSAMGIEISRGKKNGKIYPVAPKNILIQGNLFRGIGSQATSLQSLQQAYAVFLPIVRTPHTSNNGAGSAKANGNAIVVLTSSNVQIYNNTVIGATGTALYLGESSESGPPSTVIIRNNVLDGQTSDLGSGIEYNTIDGLIIDYNHYTTARVNGKALAEWVFLGYEQHATSGDPRLDATYLPQVVSPLRDSGIDLGLPFTGTAPDRGWGE
jgi:Right handed beta helix region